MCSALRPAQQIPLAFVAALGARHFQLLFGLNPFDDGDDVEAASKPGDRPNNSCAFLSLGHVRDERAIDLDLVEREAAHIGER